MKYFDWFKKTWLMFLLSWAFQTESKQYFFNFSCSGTEQKPPLFSQLYLEGVKPYMSYVNCVKLIELRIYNLSGQPSSILCVGTKIIVHFTQKTSWKCAEDLKFYIVLPIATVALKHSLETSKNIPESISSFINSWDFRVTSHSS